MGALSTVGAIADGAPSTITATKFKDSVVSFVQDGITIGSTTIPAGVIDIEFFKTSSIDEISREYPAWNTLYADGLLKSLLNSLDAIPDTGIAFPILFDPTRPIAIILKELSEIFASIDLTLSFPIIDIILSKIDIFLSKAAEITSKLKEIIDAIADGAEAALEKATEFFVIIRGAIVEALEAAGEAVNTVIAKLNAEKDRIIRKIIEIAEKIKNAALSLIPEFSLPILDLSLIFPEFDFSFSIPAFDISPLFATIELNGMDGIATKFLKMMVAFLKIPAEVITGVIDLITGAAAAASEFIIQLANAVKKIFTDIAQAVKDMLGALLGFVWDKISSIIDINPNAILEAASIIGIVTFFVKSFIVTMIGFILGSGLITLAASKILNII